MSPATPGAGATAAGTDGAADPTPAPPDVASTDGGDADYVTFGRPDIRREEIREVVASLEDAWIGTGPKVQAFEEAMADYVGAGHAVATSSCTAALHLCLEALGIGEDDEVIVPSMTFPATANVVEHAGARPVLVDVDPDSLCLAPETVQAAVTPRTRAVIPVHFAGRPAPVGGLREVADRHGLALVQDAAHCVEGRIDGASPARWGDVTCYSFYATKNVVTGEGGMAVTDDGELARRIRVLSLHGLDADAWKRYSADGFRHYECVTAGYKYNMMDLQAALGLHQLGRVEENLRARERQWERYRDALADLPLELPAPAPPGHRHARHLFTVLVGPGAPLTRDELVEALHGDGIGTGVHYLPVHQHAHYRERYGYRPEDLPVSRDVGRRTLSLPLGPGLREGEQERVVASLRRHLG